MNVVNVHNHIQQAPPGPVVVSGPSHSTIHIVHLVLTLITFGLWAPIWLIHAIILAATKRPVAVHPAPSMGYPLPAPSPQDRNRAAVEAVTQQNRLRLEARQLAASDPRTAVQLGIGRRDMPGRQFDDGGLVDINRVPAEVFTQFGGISPELAAHIVAVRDQVGGSFTSVEELMAVAQLPPHLSDEIAEYAVIIR